MSQDYYHYGPYEDKAGWSVIIPLVIMSVGLTLIVVIAGWKLGWFFKVTDVDSQYNVKPGSHQYQQWLVGAERDRVYGYDLSAGVADEQRQIALSFCSSYKSLIAPPPDLVEANTRICQGGQRL